MTAFPPLQTVHANGVDLHYIQQGSGDPVLFVHGGGATDLRTWGPQIDPFAEHYRVVAYSLRYHYPNAWDGDGSDYSTAVHALDLEAVIQELQLAPAHVVTSSYGGDIALLMAHRHPQLVRTLVLGEPPLTPWRKRLMPETDQSQEALGHSWEALGAAVLGGDVEKAVRLFAERVMGPGAYDRLPVTARQRMLDNARILSLPDGILLSDFTCEDAGEIRVPTLLLTGDASPRQFLVVADELERCMPQVERATIPQASHFLHGANPTVYYETVLAFLGRH